MYTHYILEVVNVWIDRIGRWKRDRKGKKDKNIEVYIIICNITGYHDSEETSESMSGG